MNIIHFPIFPNTHPSPLKRCGYGGSFMAGKYENLEFLDKIFNHHNKKPKVNSYQRSQVCELANA